MCPDEAGCQMCIRDSAIADQYKCEQRHHDLTNFKKQIGLIRTNQSQRLVGKKYLQHGHHTDAHIQDARLSIRLSLIHI